MSKPGLEARLVATHLLSNVVEKRSSLDGMTDDSGGQPAYRALESRDRALVRAMVKAALRHRVALETLIDKAMHKPLTGDGRAVHHHLHIALAQILFLDVPDSAAVDLAVTAIQDDKKLARFGKLTNALLRNIQRMDAAKRQHLIDHAKEAPDWFLTRLHRDYGDKADAILAANQTPPALDITVKTDPSLWARRLGGTALYGNTVRLSDYEGALTALEGFEEGAWWVQDIAAALPATLFSGDIAGKRIVDLCAAPGGKTAQLAAQGAHVTAIELNKNRIKRLEQNLARLQLTAEIIQGDLRKYKPETLFDAVLLDAPCSSTGTMRRHPDILWTKTEADIEKLATIQKEMLLAAVNWVKPGGEIIFSNCSIDKAEGENMVAALCAETDALQRVPLDDIGIDDAITSEGALRLTPLHFADDNPRMAGADGFYAAKFKRQQ